MGIPGLFAWLRKKCPFLIRKLPYNKSMSDEFREGEKPGVDVLCLDMNGIIHEACQEIYKYGNYAELESKKHPPPVRTKDEQLKYDKRMQKETFKKIGSIVHNLVYRIRPSKKLLIMVDGPAGVGKQNQQRQRRYRSAQDTKKKFETNCISPGTEFMDYLSKFLDTFIRQQVTFSAMWQKIEIVYSNHLVAGEGEHKLINYIRRHGKIDESFVLYGLDADLIMLGLSTQNRLCEGLNAPKFYIVREDQYSREATPPLLSIDISSLRQYLIEELTWGIDCERKALIDDFIFLCFLLGNDFLPHSPTIDLIEGGIELLFDSYTTACEKENSHVMVEQKIVPKVLKQILFNISINEKMLLETTTQTEKFADPLLQKYIVKELVSPLISDQTTVPPEGTFQMITKTTLKFDEYRQEYYRTKFPRHTPTEVCLEYFRGMEWVFQYYTNGIPSWEWYYPFSYSPFAREMMESVESYRSEPFHMGRPMDPFLQLLHVLPPQSKDLLPVEFHEIMSKFPTDVTIDLAGKRFDWQGVVVIAPVPNFINEYKRILEGMQIPQKRRNFLGKSYLYKYDKNLNYEHKSYYGTFQCFTSVTVFV